MKINKVKHPTLSSPLRLLHNEREHKVLPNKTWNKHRTTIKGATINHESTKQQNHCLRMDSSLSQLGGGGALRH